MSRIHAAIKASVTSRTPVRAEKEPAAADVEAHPEPGTDTGPDARPDRPDRPDGRAGVTADGRAGSHADAEAGTVPEATADAAPEATADADADADTDAAPPAPARSRAARWPLIVPAALLAAVYATSSLVRHAKASTSGYDLGIFDQAVRAYARLDAPIVPIKGPGFNLLGDHFHPWLAALAPLYRIWPDARMLLVVQAVLIGVSAIPIGRAAIDRLGTRTGLAIMVAYGLSWGIQGAIGFDFHEIALAVPLLAGATVALMETRWRAAVCWTLPLLLVKEDMGLTVAAVGGYLLLKRRWRAGGSLAVVGLGAVAFLSLYLIPRFNPAGQYAYLRNVEGGGPGGGPLDALLAFPESVATHPARLTLLLYVAGMTAFAALRSPILLIAAPIVGYRLLSDHPMHWSTGLVHYNAVLMPIVFVALLDAVALLSASRRAALRRYGRLAVPATLVIGLLAMPRLTFWHMLTPQFYRTTPHVTAMREILRHIPDGARVAASNNLAPQLTDRTFVVLFARPDQVPVDWVVVDTTHLFGVPAPEHRQRAALAGLRAQGFVPVAERDGIKLFRRSDRPDRP